MAKIDDTDVRREGAAIRHHEMFSPNGTNVNFIEKRGPNKIGIRTWGYLLLSGFAGSAVGTVFFTLALKHGNPTVINVILNIQPVISTIGGLLGAVLFRKPQPPVVVDVPPAP